MNLEDLTAILFFFHFIAMIGYNYYRLYEVIQFLEEYRGNVITPDDYEILMARYAGFFKFFEPLPDEKYFPGLYAEEKFATYALRTRKIFRYFLFSISLLLVLHLVLYLAPLFFLA